MMIFDEWTMAKMGLNPPTDENRDACIKALEPVVRRLRKQGRPTNSIIAALAAVIVATVDRAGMQ